MSGDALISTICPEYFSILGTQVSVYGTLGPRDVQLLAPQSNFSIDGGSSATYQAVQRPTVQYSTRFYTSPLLPNGEHTLVVTNLITSDSLFLDYFTVLRDENGPPSPPQHDKLQTPGSDTRPADEKSPSSNNTGMIVGSAIGAASLVIIAVALMLWFRSRNRRTQVLDDTRVHSCTCFVLYDDLFDSVILLVRENRSIETNPPFRQAHQSLGSTFLTSSDSAPNSHQYDPYDSSLAPPPGYIAEVPEQQGTGRVRPRLYLPSKFTRQHRSTAT